jgi:hypothetical protein
LMSKLEIEQFILRSKIGEEKIRRG